VSRVRRSPQWATAQGAKGPFSLPSDDGISKAKIRITRGGTSYGYKVQAYRDLSAATDANMTIQFYLDNPTRTYSHSELWKKTATGWKASGFTLE